MKTVYTPVFYATPQPSVSGSASVPTTYLDSLSRKHIALAQIVEEVPSDGREDPESKARVDAIRKQVVEAFELTSGDPADGKWIHLVQLLRLGITRGRLRWLGSTMEGKKSVSSNGWVNAHTEEEWMEWEKRWEEENRLKQKVESWQEKVEIHLPVVDVSVLSTSDVSERTKVETSLAKGQTSIENPAAVGSSKPVLKPATTILDVTGRDPRDPTALGFTVMKRSSLMATGKPKPSGKPLPDDKITGPSKLKPTPSVRATVVEPLERDLNSLHERNIADISETSFLPPSFPSQLHTSTPNERTKRRQKPPPILEIPSLSPHLNNQIDGHLHTNLAPSSSIPEFLLTPTRKLDSAEVSNRAKRPRSITPKQATASKKARTATILPSSSDVRQLSPLQTAQSEPPPTSSPEFVTPKRQGQLPTLKELLASSKKTRGSLKRTKNTTTAPAFSWVNKGKEKEKSIEDVNLPEGENIFEEQDHQATLGTLYSLGDPYAIGMGLDYDITSPTKSLSSLAASDSDSDGGGGNVHNIGDDLNPPFASAQSSSKGVAIDSTNGGKFDWMGYSSQFDMNSKIDQVSKFIEKDVDCDGWLRDSPEESQ